MRVSTCLTKITSIVLTMMLVATTVFNLSSKLASLNVVATSSRTLLTAASSVSSRVTDMPVYWINLDKDVARKDRMEEHLSRDMHFKYFKRISALTPSTTDIVMLEHECRRFSMADIAILASHLKAIHTAVYDTSPVAQQSKYALILEDDIHFQYKVDFQLLVQNAPKHFGVLQLMTSHYDQIVKLWDKYYYQQELWTYRRQDSSIWSAQAYLINKDVYKPFIDLAVQKLIISKHDVSSTASEEHWKFKIIQTFDGERGERLKYNHFKPTIQSICIFADMFVYSIGRPAYILNIPLFNSAAIGMNSSAHTTHVAHHAKGYAFHQVIQQKMYQQQQHQQGQQLPMGSEGNNYYKLPIFASIDNSLWNKVNKLNWTQISMDNPIRHWAQGSYKIANVDT